jgi:phage baseplate assembly protein W
MRAFNRARHNQARQHDAFGMTGMSKQTGAAIDGNAHIAQSVADILSTPLGSRIMRRDYGSLLFDLIDQPLNGAVRALMIGASATALARWEPRLRLRRITLAGDLSGGILSVNIEGDRTDLPAQSAHTTLSIPIRTGGISAAN